MLEVLRCRRLVGQVRVLVVDNYDSFNWSLVHGLEVLGARCEVVMNDALDVAEGAMARRARPGS